MGDLDPCEHDYKETPYDFIQGADAVRECSRCERMEVRVSATGKWVDLTALGDATGEVSG